MGSQKRRQSSETVQISAKVIRNSATLSWLEFDARSPVKWKYMLGQIVLPAKEQVVEAEEIDGLFWDRMKVKPVALLQKQLAARHRQDRPNAILRSFPCRSLVASSSTAGINSGSSGMRSSRRSSAWKEMPAKYSCACRPLASPRCAGVLCIAVRISEFAGA